MAFLGCKDEGVKCAQISNCEALGCLARNIHNGNKHIHNGNKQTMAERKEK